MKKFDPSAMPDAVSPTVKVLRTFVERSIENEVENALAAHGEDIAKIVEKSLRAVTLRIFHKNPKVHSEVKADLHAFDASIQTLFNISPEETIA
jgi:glutamyl-tRNA reductase